MHRFNFTFGTDSLAKCHQHFWQPIYCLKKYSAVRVTSDNHRRLGRTSFRSSTSFPNRCSLVGVAPVQSDDENIIFSAVARPASK